MTLPKSPYETTIRESWVWTINELEQTLARPHGRELGPIVDLVRRIACTSYAQSYRAGTSLTFTLVISTAARHDLGDEAHITVRIERMGHGGRGFCILYHGDGDWADRVGALVKTYGTDDYKVIEASLRRDLTGYYYPCEFAEGWETLQPLLVRLWDETHPNF